MNVNDELIAQISKVGGQCDALLAVACAICETLKPDSELAGLIYVRLEEMYASRLQSITNEDYFAAFESTRHLLVLALEQVRPNDS